MDRRKGGEKAKKKEEGKVEEIEMVKFQLTQLQEQMATMLALQQNQGPRRGYREQNDRSCSYCREVGHFVRECPRAEAHVRDGRCKRAEWGGITLADGARVPRIPGKTSAECVEFMFPSPPVNAPIINAANNMFELQPMARSLTMESARTEEREESEDELEEAVEEVKALEAMIVEARKKADAVRRKRFDGIELPTMPRPANLGTTQEVEGRKKKEGGPQYRHQCPAEDPAQKQSVVDKVLDAKMTISVREAMAVSYEVRTAVKNMATAKRVPTGAVAANLAETHQNQWADHTRANTNPPSHPVCSAFVPLRVIDATFAGDVKAECILDSGSQFIAMRRDVWEKTGLSLNPDTAAMVEATNSSKSSTLGAIPNVSMTIGDLELAVYVHIVEEAPFEVLLGRPFFVLTKCETKDTEDGGQVLRLTDPWEGRSALVPTRDRVRTRNAERAAGPRSGF